MVYNVLVCPGWGFIVVQPLKGGARARILKREVSKDGI